MFGINYKNWIQENVKLKVEEYLKWLNVNTCWEDIVIGYASANDERFFKYYEMDQCAHPKKLYRPGNTIVCHFTAISPELVNQYHTGKINEVEWEKICLNTRQISRGITDSIIQTLQVLGREVSLLSEREKWSHSCGAEVAGMGKFEYKEDMFYLGSQVGYLGSVITELIID